MYSVGELSDICTVQASSDGASHPYESFRLDPTFDGWTQLALPEFPPDGETLYACGSADEMYVLDDGRDYLIRVRAMHEMVHLLLAMRGAPWEHTVEAVDKMICMAEVDAVSRIGIEEPGVVDLDDIVQPWCRELLARP